MHANAAHVKALQLLHTAAAMPSSNSTRCRPGVGFECVDFLCSHDGDVGSVQVPVVEVLEVSVYDSDPLSNDSCLGVVEVDIAEDVAKVPGGRIYKTWYLEVPCCHPPTPHQYRMRMCRCQCYCCRNVLMRLCRATATGTDDFSCSVAGCAQGHQDEEGAQCKHHHADSVGAL